MTLAGLDKIKWNKLETVEGKATKAPAILRDLASGDAKKVPKAAQWLFTEVLHQSTPAPSAETFVPFLVELAGQAKQPARWELLALLGDLACDGDHRPYVFAGYSGKSGLHDAVAAGHATYLKALADKVGKARAGAAFVLAWLPEHAKPSVAALKKAIATEKDATAFASMLLALARLAGDTKHAKAALKHDEQFVRAAGVVALAMVGPLPKDQQLETLAAMDGVDFFSWWHGSVGALLVQAVLHAAIRDGDIALLEKMWFSAAGRAFGAAAVQALFPTTIEPKKLTKTQRSLLDRVTADSTRYGELAKQWEERGLPASAKDARKQLGFATIESPLDMKLTVDGVTKRFADHMADAVHDPVKRVPLARALAKGRSGAQVLDYLFEATQLTFGAETSEGVEATQTEIMAAAADDIVPLLLKGGYRTVQREDGRLITPTLAPTRPSAVALARRGVRVSDNYLDATVRGELRREQDVSYYGDAVVAFLRSVDAKRRVPLLASIYRNIPTWVQSGKLLIEPLMVETPHKELTAELLARVKELEDDFAYGRKYDNSQFSKGYKPAAMKKMKPKDHPLTAKLLVNINAYVEAAKSAKLAKDAKSLGDAIAKFLVS